MLGHIHSDPGLHTAHGPWVEHPWFREYTMSWASQDICSVTQQHGSRAVLGLTSRISQVLTSPMCPVTAVLGRAHREHV